MKTKFLLVFSLLFYLFHAFGQDGYSSGTMGMLQSQYYEAYVNDKDLSKEQKDFYRSGALKAILADRIVPEEILNYHRHLIAMPAKGSKVNLAPEFTEHPLLQNHYLMQLGIASDTVIPQNRKATGIMYVLDISGSMSDGKLEKAKEAILASLGRMYPTDYFGITLFDDQAEVLIPYQLFGARKTDIINKVKALTTRGGTNILSGLDMAIDQMMNDDLTEHPKSILLLTDGNTNVGVTEKDELIQAYQAKTKNSVRITTMGIGIDLHQDLLRDLSEKTHGQFHYIERYEDIQKTCVNEFGSLAFPIGKNVMLSVEIPACFNVKQVYGASSWVLKEGVLQIPLADINYFLTQVVLVDLELNNDVKMSIDQLKSTLSYTDYSEGTSQKMEEETHVITSEKTALYTDFMKNFLIAYWAVELKSMSEAYAVDQDEKQLQTKINELLNNPLVSNNAINTDKDVLRIKTVFEKLTVLLS
jgi:dihydroneopterin aldolase/uncharacterized protein YegL